MADAIVMMHEKMHYREKTKRVSVVLAACVRCVHSCGLDFLAHPITLNCKMIDLLMFHY